MVEMSHRTEPKPSLLPRGMMGKQTVAASGRDRCPCGQQLHRVCVCVLFLKRKGYGTEVSPTHTHTTQSVNVSALNSSRYACCVILSTISITLSINVMQKGVHTHTEHDGIKKKEKG